MTKNKDHPLPPISWGELRQYEKNVFRARPSGPNEDISFSQKETGTTSVAMATTVGVMTILKNTALIFPKRKTICQKRKHHFYTPRSFSNREKSSGHQDQRDFRGVGHRNFRFWLFFRSVCVQRDFGFRVHCGLRIFLVLTSGFRIS